MKTHIPFDLAKALAGEPVQTRDGRKVLRVAHFPEASFGYKISALIQGSASPIPYCESGLYTDGSESNDDLFMAPKTKTMYAAIHSDETCFVGRLRESPEEANERGAIAIATITWNTDEPPPPNRRLQ